MDCVDCFGMGFQDFLGPFLQVCLAPFLQVCQAAVATGFQVEGLAKHMGHSQSLDKADLASSSGLGRKPAMLESFWNVPDALA